MRNDDTDDLFQSASPPVHCQSSERTESIKARHDVPLKGLQPLADQLRPQHLAEVIGQEHIIGPNGMLSRMLLHKTMPSMIFWGGPGCGKTTIARVLAQETSLRYEQLSAIFTGVADLKKIFDNAERHLKVSQKATLLFVDEIHRFNRAQQDSFLAYVERGTIVLVGATTENPSFALNAALLSRCQVIALNRLESPALEKLLQRAEKFMARPLPLTPEGRTALVSMADGDGRYLLNLAEQVFGSSEHGSLGPDQLEGIVTRRAALYDRDRDEHYNLISALHKALRGSDPDAGLYWFARMLEGGEDPRYLARRLTRFAAEDVGMADPNALKLAVAAWQSYERLGSPEGELSLAQLVVYLATAPKSNAVYMAYKKARALARETGSLAPPKHILNAPTNLMKDMGYGAGYAYDHDVEGGFSGQNYFPDSMTEVSLYMPTDRGCSERKVE